jgi:nitric oxide reductase large subunit
MMDINDKAVEITSRLRLGAMIARDRNINLDFAKIADESADVIDSLRQQLTKPADDTISVSKGEWEAMKKDTERYQWLRNNGCKFPDIAIGSMTENLIDEELDAAVDQAIAKDKP